MTVSELYNQVAGLGFESSLEDEGIFLNAANRALLQVARIRPATRTCRVNHKPPRNLLGDLSFSPTERSEALTYEAEGAKAYYFEADGNGVAYLEYFVGGQWTPFKDIPLSSDGLAFKPYRGHFKNGNEFVQGRVRIRFEGEYTYSVRCVAMYATVYTPNPDDVFAYEPYTKYDIEKMAGDFLSLCSPPIVEEEGRKTLSDGYDIEDGRVLLLPRGRAGVYTVRYNHRPEQISDEDSATVSDQKIDLDSDLCAILPNLVAAYILAEDEPQLAEYYLTLYNQQAAEIRAQVRSYAATPIELNGW